MIPCLISTTKLKPGVRLEKKDALEEIPKGMSASHSLTLGHVSVVLVCPLYPCTVGAGGGLWRCFVRAVLHVHWRRRDRKGLQRPTMERVACDPETNDTHNTPSSVHVLVAHHTQVLSLVSCG